MESRLYFLVMYNLSPLQKGLQSGHAALEYSEKYQNCPDYKNFVQNHKTFIILDGGTSHDQEKTLEFFEKNGIKYAEFREPDLNNAISAIAFLVKEKYYSRDGRQQTAFGQWLNQFQLAR